MGDPAATDPPDESPVVETENVRPFVGRAREVRELTLALDAACSGHGSLSLVSGEPGIGKSRLMEELADVARRRGCLVLIGRCWDGGGAPAYWPWVQVVRSAGGEFEDLAVAARPGRSGGSTDVDDPVAARFRLFEHVARFISERMAASPVLIVLDDLHAADEPSILLLSFLATSVVDQPMLLVASYRESDPRVREEADLFGELSRLGRRIPLAGLTRPEIARYIEITTGMMAEPEWVERVYELTAGNPFFVGEVVRAEPEGRPGDDKQRLPEEVRALIRRRLAHLSPEAGGVLRTAAVLGRVFELQVIAETTTLSRERLIDVLSEAQAAGIISADPDVGGSYTFAHDLLREAVYEDLPPTRRMEIHRTAALVLERVSAADPDPELAAIAHHFAQAAPLGGADVAVEYATRAGERAARLLAYEDAARQFERALQLMPPGEGSLEERVHVLRRLGDSYSRSADSQGAKRTFREAAEVARRIGRSDLLAAAALGYVSSSEPVRLGFGGLLLTAIFEDAPTGIALLEDALAGLPEEDGPLRARVIARLATALYPTPQTERRVRLAREAFEMSLRLGDPEALIEALHAHHWATLGPDSVHQRLENAQRTLLVATAAGEPEAAFLGRQARLHCFLELFDMSGYDVELAAMEQLAETIRQPFYSWHVACLRGVRLLIDGNVSEAEALVRNAYQTGRLRTSEYVSYLYEYAQLVGVRWTQGRLEDVRDQIRRHGDGFRTMPRWRDALLAAEISDEAGARAEIERHARNRFGDLPRDGLWLLHVSALAQACVLVHDRSRAETLYELLTPFDDRNAISVSTVPFGPVAMRLGMLAGLLERWNQADAHFGKARDLCEGFGAPALRARVLLEHAQVLLARAGDGDTARAADLLTQAGGLCDELHLTGIAERVERALRGIDDRAFAAPPQAVFRREGQFWTVALGGRTARLHDLRGLRYIADLLAVPGREVYVLDLLAAHAGPPSVEAGTHELPVTGSTSWDPVLDARAKEGYRRRLRDLAQELEEARSWHDTERVLKLEAEVDAITDELERAVGLGGRDRQMDSPAERARVSVTKAIKVAIRTVRRECPPLADHLEASIHTGRFCSYAPPGQEPPRWEL